MKVVAGVLGAAAVLGLVVLAVAGLTGALAILLTALAIMAMIALGGIMGGRHTPDRPPLERPGTLEGGVDTEDESPEAATEHPGEG